MLAFLLTVGAVGCAEQREQLGTDVLLDPQRFAGDRVTVRADIVNYLSPVASVVAGRMPPNDDLVVIDRESRPFGEGDLVEVTGTIGTFDVELVEGERSR